MATRLYIRATTTPSVSPAFHSNWEDTTFGVRRHLIAAKEAATETLAGTLTGEPGDALSAMLITDSLDGDQTVSGTWGMVMRGRELATEDNVNRRYRAIRVFSGDGSTVRGTCVAQSAAGSSVEYSTSFAGVQFAVSGGITSVSALNGDRIVVEYGPGSNTTGTTPNWEFVIGGTGTDHANSNGDTSGTVGWVEFSADLVFQTGTPAARPAGPLALATAVTRSTVY